MPLDARRARPFTRLPETWARASVKHFDTLLRRFLGVMEFSTAEGCILRLAKRRNDRDITLSDGTRVIKGEVIGELHLWNERLPLMKPEGPDLAWAQAMLRLFIYSLEELARYVEENRDFHDVRAFRGETVFALGQGLADRQALAARIGFDVILLRYPRWSWGRFAQFWQGFYGYALIWTFQPTSSRGKDILHLQRDQIWVSRDELLRRYGKSHHARKPPKSAQRSPDSQVPYPG